MSNIIINNDTLLMLTDDIKYIKKYDISKSFIEEILRQIIPTKSMEPLITYSVVENSYNEGNVSFVPSKELIEIDLRKLNYWIENSIDVLMKDYNLKDKETLKAYQLIQIISHEVEHAYQYLMGKRMIYRANNIIANVYKDIYDLIVSDSNFESKECYFNNFKRLLLERNAQIESFDLIMQCAKYNNQLDIYNAYKNLYDYWALIGYVNSCQGSIIETLRLLKLNDDYLTNNKLQMYEKERIRYGFPISNKTRKKLLKK